MKNLYVYFQELELDINVGKRLKEIRKDNDLTIAEMAKRLKIERHSYVKYEQSPIKKKKGPAYFPPLDTVMLCCLEFKVATNWLLYGIGDKYENIKDDPISTYKKLLQKINVVEAQVYIHWTKEIKQVIDSKRTNDIKQLHLTFEGYKKEILEK